jgi:tetratricopeptide (TPR) repeat protein
MKSRCVLLLGLVSVCAAQEAMQVRGKVVAAGYMNLSQLSAQLANSRGQIDRAPIDPSGAFEFRDLPSGNYTLRVSNQYGAEIISERIHVSHPVTFITVTVIPVTLPDQESQPTAQTVSVRQLQHQPPKKALHAMAKAQDLAQRGANERAVAELEKAIALDPEFAVAHSNLGVQYALLNQNEKAAAEFRRAAQLDPGSSMFESNLACVLIWMRKYSEAEEHARIAVYLDNSSANAHYLLGVILARRPETRASGVSHLKTAARQFPRAYLILAEVYRAEGQNQLAKEEMQRYLDADPAASRQDVEKWIAALR